MRATLPMTLDITKSNKARPYMKEVTQTMNHTQLTLRANTTPLLLNSTLSTTDHAKDQQ